jgi:adenosylmethionine-8-amino-7-oxononanoate aminotransferase
MAKGITSGYLPLSATAVRREVFEAFIGTDEYDHFRHVNTFGGNPAACALALRNLEIMEEEDLAARSAAMGEKLRAGLGDLEDHPNVGQIRNKGLLFGLELVEDKESRAPATADKVAKVIAGCKKRGLIVGKNGDTVAGFNNVVTLAPPLIVSDEDLAFISGVLKETLQGL